MDAAFANALTNTMQSVCVCVCVTMPPVITIAYNCPSRYIFNTLRHYTLRDNWELTRHDDNRVLHNHDHTQWILEVKQERHWEFVYNHCRALHEDTNVVVATHIPHVPIRITTIAKRCVDVCLDKHVSHTIPSTRCTRYGCAIENQLRPSVRIT